MKIRMDVKALKNCLDMTSSVINSNNINSILQHVKMTAKSKSISFYAIGKESQIEIITYDCEVDETGEVAIPYSRILRLLSEYKAGDSAIMEEIKSGITIQVKNNKFNFPTVDPGEFPKPEEIDDSTASEVPAAEFISGITHVSHNANTAVSQRTLSGICIRFVDKLTFIATDTRQMAIYKTDYNNAVENRGDCIIGIDTAINAARVIGLSDCTHLKIFPKKNKLVLKTDNVIFSCSLIDGVYPKVDKIAAYPAIATLKLDKKEFSSFLRQADLVTSKESTGVVLDCSSNALEFHSHSPDYGESNLMMETNLEARNECYSKIVGKFNAQFLLSDVTKLKGDNITLHFTTQTNNRPIYITAEEDPNIQYLIMPLSLSPIEKQEYGIENG